MRVDSPLTVLRPSLLRRRIPFFVLVVLFLALSVGALFYTPVIGAVGVLFTGFGTVNATFRLFHPRSYATELDEEEFRTFDWRGRPVHRVRWVDVQHLTVFNGNGFGGPGTVLHLAWRCNPRQPGRGRQPWVRGGRNNVGEEFDGALPDPYLGIKRMLKLFLQRANAADIAATRAGGSRSRTAGS
jgi:hypothetical protein